MYHKLITGAASVYISLATYFGERQITIMSAPREAGVVPLLVRQLDLQLFNQKLSQPSYIILQQPCLGVAAEYIFHIWCIC